jgi:16S rRNA (cytidine1402-2'-O)-methyltransferase
MGTLFIVATPIGNLEDITIRAMRVLLSVDGVAAEDTRRTGQLINHIKKTYAHLFPDILHSEKTQYLFPFHEHNEKERMDKVLTALKNGLDVALVSDAGTPLISDPGFRIVRECIAEGIPVEAIPGPSSVITALTLSGLPTDTFTFIGYPPQKGGHRLTFFKEIKSMGEISSQTYIMFEAPHKLITTLGDMLSVLGDIEVTFTRELTKVHQEVKKETISIALKGFVKKPPKGEFVVLFHI